MNGKLILVSGLSGAGKTTLIGGALKQMPHLKYLTTYTTRPIRDGEGASHEYVFVTEDDYNKLRTSASLWDHTDYSGFSYGADAGSIKEALNEGNSVLCSVAPDMAVIAEMTKLYDITPETIWIETPKDVAKNRIYQDDLRNARNEDFAISSNFDHIFEPRGIIEVDVAVFMKLLEDIV